MGDAAMRLPHTQVCAAALARGPLHRVSTCEGRNTIAYRFGRRRLFSARTVNVLIGRGEAVRRGAMVVGARA